MVVENGDLVLASSRKLIVPREKTEDLIMGLHSNNHMPISLIIYQIQQKYTWTKKNFGLDHETVIDVVTSHCKKYECWKDIKNVLTKKNLSSNIPSSSFTPVDSRDLQGPKEGKHKVFHLQHLPIHMLPLKTFTSEREPCSSTSRDHGSEWHASSMPSSSSSRSKNMDSLLPHTKRSDGIQEEFGTSFTHTHGQAPMLDISQSKVHFLQALGLSRKPEKVVSNHNLASNIPIHRIDDLVESNVSRTRKHSLIRSCKKIANIIEFKRLLKSAEHNPKLFPAVLMNQKTKFLGSLSLAPRRICSKKMLSKFNEELHKKKVVERRSLYRGHKVLRDRNKILKKMSHHKKPERLSYLSTPKRDSTRHNNLLLDSTGRERSNERERYVFHTSNKMNLSQNRCISEGKNPHCGFKEGYHLNDASKTIEEKDHLRKAKEGNVLLLRKHQVPLREPLEKSHHSTVQEPPKRSYPEMQRNVTSDALTVGGEYSKTIQMGINLNQNIKSYSKFSNVSQSHPLTSNIFTAPPHQFHLVQPILMPIAPNAAFLPPSRLPFLVQPMVRPQIQGMNDPRQNIPNAPVVWGYVANGRVNVLNTKGNSKTETHLQIKPVAQSGVELSRNKLGKDGSNGVMIQPYRLLAPKNKVSNDQEKQNTAIGNSNMINIFERDGNSKNERESYFSNPSYVSNERVPTATEIDVEMKKLTKWIRRMKLNIVPCICAVEKDVETLKRDLIAELNYGINTVREIRYAVQKIEKTSYEINFE